MVQKKKFVSHTPWIQRAFDNGEITEEEALDYDIDERIKYEREAYEYEHYDDSYDNYDDYDDYDDEN